MRKGVITGKGVRDGVLLVSSLSLLAPSRGWAHQAPAAALDPTLTAFFSAWSFRADVMLVLMVLAVAYTCGWWRLSRRGHWRTARGWQSAAYLTGLMVLGLALLSPIDRFASLLLTLHMGQHLLLIMVAAPLVLLADPLPTFLWALPRRTRHRIGRLFSRDAAVRQVLWILTWMPVAWLVFVGHLWAWHHPVAYQAALRHEIIHDLEHLTFFGTALLFWWPIINPAPRVHGRIHPGHPTLHILYLMTAAAQTVVLGALIALPERVLYPFYTAAPRLWGLTPLNDQALGGGIMWVSAHMYLLPILLVVARLLAEEERVEVGAGIRDAPQAPRGSAYDRL
jgi:putative membrane protein